MGELLDAPNQQVVRPDGSGPSDEGTGGSAPEPEKPKNKKEAEEAKE